MPLPHTQSLSGLQHRAAQPCRARRHRPCEVARLLCRHARPAGDRRDHGRHLSARAWKSAAIIASCCEEGPTPEARDLGFKVFSDEDLDKAEHFFKGKGLPVEWVERPYQARTFRTRDPHGIPLEFYSKMDRLPPIHQKYALYKGVKPLRIDHFNCFSPNVDEAVAFYNELGFRVTEYTEDEDDRAAVGGLDAPQGRRARHRLHQRPRPAPAPCRLLGADAAQHHRPARPDGDHRLARRTSSAAPAGTASPTPSSSTSATPTAIASRSIARTTRRSIPISSRSTGTSRTRSARRCGARRRRRAGSRKAASLPASSRASPSWRPQPIVAP